jgi:sigma-B regulation protein RsbU (phosphoserine phosphatase)
VKYRQNELMLNSGDKLFLYTDGVTEAMDIDHNLYGDPRLEEIINTVKNESAAGIVHRIRDDVHDFAGEAPQADDITMLCLIIN